MSSIDSLSEKLSRRFNIERGSSISLLFHTGPQKNREPNAFAPSFSTTFGYVLSCSAPTVDLSDSSISQIKRETSIFSSSGGDGEDFGFEVAEEVSLKNAYSLYRV